jgi:hypothetical protein
MQPILDRAGSQEIGRYELHGCGNGDRRVTLLTLEFVDLLVFIAPIGSGTTVDRGAERAQAPG